MIILVKNCMPKSTRIDVARILRHMMMHEIERREIFSDSPVDFITSDRQRAVYFMFVDCTGIGLVLEICLPTTYDEFPRGKLFRPKC